MGLLDRHRNISLFDINMTFMVTAILLVTLGFYLQSVNIYSGLIVTELVIVLGSALVYTAVGKIDIISVFRLRRVAASTLLTCVLATVAAYPVGIFLNLVFNIILSLFGQLIPTPVPVATNGLMYVANLAVIGLIAGAAEELYFRGLILSGYSRFGRWPAIVITALLFGLFHFNVQNFVAPVFLGIVFGYMTAATGSIYPAITGHFVNNAISVTIAYAAVVLPDGQSAAQGTDTGVLIAGAVFWGTIAVIGAYFMIRLLGSLNEMSYDNPLAGDTGYPPGTALVTIKDMIPLGVTILLFAWIVVMEIGIIIGR
jgi:membrane protease YdiL (CAAX protease family)